MPRKRKIEIPNKEKEMAIIEALASGDTYFADSVSAQDAERMVDNIANDFPIFVGTMHDPEERVKIMTDCDELRTLLQQAKDRTQAQAQVHAEELRLAYKRLDRLIVKVLWANYNESDGVEFPSDDAYYSLQNIVRLKMKNSVPLDPDEKEYVMNLVGEAWQTAMDAEPKNDQP